MTRYFKKYVQVCLVVVFMCGFTACKKENVPTALQIQKPTVYSNAYYVKLRAYKASDHAVCFLWIADYGVKGVSASLGERFAGVPDSVDYISLWGGIPDSVVNPNDYKEMRFAQRVKGTKMLNVTLITQDRFASYTQDDNGIRQFADKLVSDVYKNDLDGLDIDYEPNGGFFQDPSNFIKLITRVSQFVGPKSGTGKILDIDYYGDLPPSVLGDYVDFVVQQDYYASSDNVLQNAYNNVSGYITPNKYIATENMGDLWQTGGTTYTNSAGITMNSLLGMAKWNPTQGRKGGFGAFFDQRDYYNPVPYGYTRAAIQACNPAKN